MILRALGAALIIFLLTLSRTFAEVTIASFQAQVGTSQIKLLWTSAAERKNWGFNIERSIDQRNWQHLGATPSVKSQSPCIQNLLGASYEFIDSSLSADTQYYYRLQLYGQPCGDPNTYYEQVVAAMLAGSTATLIPTRMPVASPTFIAATTLPTQTPTKRIITLPVISPTIRPTATRQMPTKIAIVQNRVTPSPIIQSLAPTSLPTSVPSPVVEAKEMEREDVTNIEEPIAATQTPSFDFVRGGIIALAGFFGLTSFICAVFAVYLFARSFPR